MWRRYRFKTRYTDWRPAIFNPKYPYWCTGEGFETLRCIDGDQQEENGYFTIVAYLPEGEDLLKYWDDAEEIEFTEREEIKFSDRFPKPEWYEES